MSKASPPRTSPTTSRSGRIRSAARTSSRTLTAPAPFGVRGARFQAHDVRVIEPQLRGLLDRDDPLAGSDRRARARSRTWSCPRSSRPTPRCSNRRAPSSRGTRPVAAPTPKSASASVAHGEPADREARTVGSERREHRVESRAVGEPRVDHRRRAIEPEPERRDHSLGDAHDRIGVEIAGDRLDRDRSARRTPGADRSP